MLLANTKLNLDEDTLEDNFLNPRCRLSSSSSRFFALLGGEMSDRIVNTAMVRKIKQTAKIWILLSHSSGRHQMALKNSSVDE